MSQKKVEQRTEPSGIVVFNKPEGFTSFGAVKQVKKLFRVKKAGHTGTLDPFATGILPICLNRATKVASFVSGMAKEYRTVIRLGQSSDTYDRTGEITDHGITEYPSREEIEQAVEEFRGRIVQTPPLFSALKVEGRPLYERARKGESFDMETKARQVVVSRFEILRYEPPELEVDIRASKGTYVRSLAHDLGKKLGTGGLLKDLVRTTVGPYSLENAWTLEQLEELAKKGRIDEAVRGIDELVESLPEYPVSKADFLELSQGKSRPASAVEDATQGEGEQLPRGGVFKLTVRGGKGFVVAECAQPGGDPQAAWELRPLRAYRHRAPLL